MKNIKVKFDISGNELSNSDVENIWCLFDEINKEITIDNIPLYKNGISYGDKISIKLVGENIWLDKIQKKGGNKTIRLYFLEKTKEQEISSILELLTSLGLSYEGNNGYLFGVNIPKNITLEEVYLLLDKYTDRLSYEVSDE